MEKFINLKSYILNRRILTFILLPFVIIGMFLVYKDSQLTKNAYGVDPLIVTYDGGPPPNPMFYVTNMLPGDEVPPAPEEGKLFNVKNDSPDPESVVMDLIMTEEEKEFADILDVLVTVEPSDAVIFSGKLQALLDSPPIDLGNIPAASEKSYRIKVKFPTSAGNEYQLAKVVFNIIWTTQGPSLDIPQDCKFLEGGITRVVQGTEGNDFIFGTRANELFILKGGNDVVFASKGNDIILGGDGDDIRLDGSDGNDCIVGGNGNDKIDGSDNNDVLFGNDGDDNIDGSDDDDLIFGGLGNDTIDAGGNNDKVGGNEGDDNIEGGSGNDDIHGNTGNDTIEGESGNDKLYGDEGDDDLDGGSGMDYIDGGLDDDVINGGSNTDSCINGESYTSCE